MIKLGIAIFAFIIFSVQFKEVKGQAPISVTTDSFILLCHTNLENGRPIVFYLVAKELSFLKALKTIRDRDTFMCELVKNTTLFEEPFFTLSKNIGFYHLENKRVERLFLQRLTKKIEILNMSYSPNLKYEFNTGGDAYIKIAKFRGDFWQIEHNSNISTQIFVPNTCYMKEFEYNLKDISKTEKLDKLQFDLLNQ